MLSPREIRLIIRHLNCIDHSVSRRTMDKRPWQEVSLTSHFCNLLDEDTQSRENLDYSIPELNDDLRHASEITRASFEVQTHEYSSVVENLLTQADFGFVLNYRDFLIPKASWSIAWLIQAKRLTPDMERSPIFDERSTFKAFSAEQNTRMKKLRDEVGLDFIKYLHYCPRPEFLGPVVMGKLSYLRNADLTKRIFDFSLGLELYNELLSGGSTLGAGLIVSGIENPPHTLGQAHGAILRTTWPFSWFLIGHLASGMKSPDLLPLFESAPSDVAPARIKINPSETSRTFVTSPLEGAELVHAIARGDRAAVERLRELLGIPENQRFTTFVPHTLTINISVGSDLDPETREIRLE